MENVRFNIFIYSLILLMVIFCILSETEVEEAKAEVSELKAQFEAMQPQEVPTLEGPYTQITDLSSVMYVNKMTVDTSKAIKWIDVNGISGFDVTIDGTHYRYIEGHIPTDQLALYAPFLYYEGNVGLEGGE